MHRLHALAFLLTAPLVLPLVACDDENDDDDDIPAEPENLIQELDAAGEFDTLLDGLAFTGLSEELESTGPFTMFAPTNAAFDQLPEGVVDDLFDDEELFRTILQFHLVPTELTAAEIEDEALLGTVQGENIRVLVPAEQTPDGADIVLNGLVQVSTTAIAATNGIIQPVDAVLFPGTMAYPGTLGEAVGGHPILSDLADAALDSNIDVVLEDDQAGGLTLLAPQDSAFEAVSDDLAGISQAELTDILEYHLIDAIVFQSTLAAMNQVATLLGEDIDIEVVSGVTVLNEDQADIVYGDLECENGILQVLDGVLLPPE